MTCAAFARKIESALLNCSGVTFAVVDLSEQKATVHFNSLKSDLGDLKRAINTVGISVLESDVNTSEVTNE